MNTLDAVREALGTIRVHRLRAFFIVLGTVVGVTFLITVVTLIEGMNAQVERDLIGKIHGFNTIHLTRTPERQLQASPDERRGWTRSPALSFDDAEWLAGQMEVPGVFSVSSTGNGRVGVPGGRLLDGVKVIGASAPHFQVRGMAVERGRAFTEHEAKAGVPVAVLGREVADKLFGARSPLGRKVTIRGRPFRVVGVLEKQGSLFTLSMDNLVIAPAGSSLNGVINPRNQAGTITFRVRDPALVPLAAAEMEGWMRVRHRLRPAEPNDFSVSTSDVALALWRKISGVMMIAGPGLISISLIVSVVVIMNIMLVSVAERRAEIGLRKSLGARGRDILLQFLVEAGTLSGIGGLVGVGLGALLAFLISALSPLPARVAPWSVGFGLLLGIGVGIAAGVYPAYRASRLDPIQALRHE